MLFLLVVVLCGSAWVLARLSSGTNVDLTQAAAKVLQLDGSSRDRGPDEQFPQEESGQTATVTAAPAVSGQSPASSVSETEAPAPAAPGERSFTLTAAGTCAVEPDMRRSGYVNDTKKYDFTDLMMLLRGELRADVNTVFLENILNDDWKVSATVVPACAADMLKAAGFDTVLCGFSGAWEKKGEGIAPTRAALEERGLTPLGIYESEEQTGRVVTVNGIRVAFLQYTATIPASTRRTMEKADADGEVPPAEIGRITSDIQRAREDGAEVVVVFLNWGKEGGKTPDKSQRALAQQVSDAGAHLIIGSGSRTPQAAEYLTSGSRQTLCIWSLGTLLSDKRTSIIRIASYLAHVTIVCGADGSVRVENPEYTPLYTWKYHQDGKDYYRCVKAGPEAPDGMDSEQQKSMNKAAATVEQVLADTPLQLRGGTE